MGHGIGGIMIKLAFISNINNIDNITTYGSIDFALARQCEYKNYYNYFKKTKKDIILDCNIHEKDNFNNWDEYIEIAINLKAKYIICPDELKDAKKTLSNYNIFTKKYYEILESNNIKLMGVPQGNTIKEIDYLFKKFNNSKKIGIIGNSFDLSPILYVHNKILNQFLNRQNIVNSWSTQLKKPLHFLGSNTLKEIEHFNMIGNKYFHSMDSKLLLRLSKNNVILNEKNFNTLSWKTNTLPKIEFNDSLTKTTLNTFSKNVKFLKNRGYL